MTPEQLLRERLRKIEALFAGAATEGERVAAGAAANRIRQRLGRAAGKENEIEVKFSISDVLSRQLFVEQVLWPEFEELSAALSAYLSEITERVIQEEVHGETGEADEVDEPPRIGR